MKLVLLFIILTIILVTGILFLMKPSVFNSLLAPYGNSHEDQSAPSLVPKEIIMLGSIFTVIAIVGLSILGFIIVRSSEEEETME